MDTFYFNPDSVDRPTFSYHCGGHEYNDGPYVLSGRCSQDEDGTIQVNFQAVYENDETSIFFVAHLDEHGSLVGYRSWSDNVSEENYDDRLIFRRAPPEIMCHRPSPVALVATKYRSLWVFAIEATLQAVRKQLWSWPYFRERRAVRKGYIHLSIQANIGRLPVDQNTEFLKYRKALSPSESIFYRSIRQRFIETVPGHE